MQGMTLAAIASACGGKLCNADGKEAQEICCAVMDSRKIEAGGLFIAFVGERVDGHGFIGQVFEAGALCVVTEKSPQEVEAEHGVPQESWGAYITVESSFTALKKIAAYYRSILQIPVVGITGSVGKTSTKEMIAAVLGEKYRVLKTEGNYNNEIGLPLTLLRLRREHEAAVIEMGISDFGEMSRLGEIARPNICVMTNIGQCHLEKLHDRAGIYRAKSEIFEYLQEDGEICLNGEDDILYAVKKVHGKPVHYFGLSERTGADAYLSDVENLGLRGSNAVLHVGAEKTPVRICLPGRHMVINAAAAACVGHLLGLTAEEIAAGIGKAKPLGGRSNLLEVGGMLLLDDCYNANPVSVRAALDLLMTANGRTVAILGDMFELGEKEKELHADVGHYAIKQGVDALYCVGALSQHLYDAAMGDYDGSQDIRYFETGEELAEELPDLLQRGDTVLIKASHGMGFARIVEKIKELFP